MGRSTMKGKYVYKVGETPESIYARAKGAEWLIAVIRQGVPMESHLFDCFHWVVGDAAPLLEQIKKAAKELPKSAKKDKIQVLLKEIEDDESSFDHSLKVICKHSPLLQKAIAKSVLEQCAAIAGKAQKRGADTRVKAKKQLKEIFGLDDVAVKLCEYVFLIKNFRRMDSFFEDYLEIQKHDGRYLFAIMMQTSVSELSATLAMLGSSGFLEVNSSSLYMCDWLEEMWTAGSQKNMARMFCQPLQGETLPLTDFSVQQEQVQHLCKLLCKKGPEPLHIMLYGAPGTGKSTFARSLAKECGLKAWTVPNRDNDNDGDRRTSLLACLHTAGRQEGAFVVVDEAERLLDTSPYFSKSTQSKAWLNEFLERPGQRIIWITNHIEHIDMAVRRRFTYSIYFEELGEEGRKNIWRQVLAKNRAAKLLSHQDIELFDKKFPVQAGLIQTAVQQSKRLHPKSKKDFKATLELALGAAVQLQKNGQQPKAHIQAAELYTEEGANLNGSVSALLGKFKRANAVLNKGRVFPPGAGTMLFYGPPGTGKTALARYLAQELKRECIVKKASDLLGMYVGESEQNVAQAFAMAEQRGAVLVIDEADSFIYSRDTAVRSWEITLVNEFLTNLEECRCFCICTTNRRGNIDSAAMRRFAYKAEFTYSGPEQIHALYNKLLAPLATGAMPGELKAKLMTMPNLTPGDFRVVVAKFGSLFADEQAPTHKMLVEALRQEQSLKLEQRNRKIGFGG